MATLSTNKPRYHHLTLLILTTITLTACTNPKIQTVENFRAARKSGNLELAQSYLTQDPRVWYEKHEGPGNPWILKQGRYKNWDTHFNGQSDLSPWQTQDQTVYAVAEETNDYYKLLERQSKSRYRITYFFADKSDKNNHQPKIAGYMISAADPNKKSPPAISRYEEFKAWALAHEPAEWEYLHPQGKLDPTDDRAPRTRKLANRWRTTVGLPILE